MTPGAELVAEALARAYARDLRERGRHNGVAVAKGPHLCAVCQTPWPCKKTRAEVPSSR
jgi:hypothetical protein